MRTHALKWLHMFLFSQILVTLVPSTFRSAHPRSYPDEINTLSPSRIGSAELTPYLVFHGYPHSFFPSLGLIPTTSSAANKTNSF